MQNREENRNNENDEYIKYYHLISELLQTSSQDITDVCVLKKGMTNHSYVFKCKGQKMILRIPGEGTASLINRIEEANVYQIINGHNISDEIVYLNPEDGIKISCFIENSRVCDPNSISDLKACMKKLRAFHSLELKVGHNFDLFSNIEYYESLWKGESSIYVDYRDTKKKIFSLKHFIQTNIDQYCLAHIDAVPDNFLFTPEGDIRLIDWEYAGMQDPHVDVAMFCIYSMYDQAQIDQLIDIYFQNQCAMSNRIKIYAYIAVCGLLWSNWCEYKRLLGIEFGEYALKQYQYAREYYDVVIKKLRENNIPVIQGYNDES